MGPKKKGGKKAQDDWDDGLGETPDPIAAAAQQAKDEETAQDKAAEEANPDEEFGGGGLMAALKRNRGKKVKKGKKVEEFDEGLGEDPTEDGANDDAAPADLAAKAPEEADADDLFGPAKGKGGKGGKQQAQQKGKGGAQNKDDEDDDEDDEGGGIKSKKQKEKEKKEREKQRKKEQAAKKKTTAPPPAAKPEPVKQVEAVKEEVPAPSSKAADGKKKKVPAALAAIQKQQEELRRRQEEEQRLKQEELDRIAELERQAEEEERKRIEAKAAKKQKEKEKIEQQKREGTYLTKAQKEQQAAQKRRMQQMIESGVKVAGLEQEPDTAADKKPEKPSKATDKKKKGGLNKRAEEERRLQEEAAAAVEAQKKMEQLKIAEEQAKKAAEEAAKAKDNAKDDSEGEDWEAMADQDEEGVKDSWDAPSEDEKPVSKTTNGKTAAASAQDEAEDSDEDDSEEDSDESDSEEELTATQKEEARRKREAAERREKKHQEALAARSKDNLRSPICCILGHVDTGKTKLLDKVRQTNVQEGEAGGITQQIGATYFPVDALQKKTAVVNKDNSFEFKVPGLLIIDTPGHESFTNLRSRGSSLCNIAILVVDIMHGLEPQTLESMRLLRDKKTPFIVALNKIDRLYGWSRIDNNGFQDSLAMQKKSVQAEFEKRVSDTKVAFAEQGFNSELWYENKSMARNVSLVPTSAHTGEGVPDLLKLLVMLSQERMASSLMYLSEVEATILEVKVVEGLGTTIDVVLSNGILREGDRIVLCGLNGPIATNIRALLTPAEMKELRIKSQYVHNKEVKAAMGVKIAANDLESAIAGSRLLVVGEDDDEEDLEEAVMSDLENLLGRISRTGRGVSVQASTLGSLEALLEFLRTSKIPVANISIGPVFKRDVMQCGTMLEKAPEYAVMLCFDVKVDKEAQAYADDQGIKIFQADIIYHLFDNFTKHQKQLAEKRKEESKMHAVFPAVLRPIAVFNKTSPIVVGVDVIEGCLRTLTPVAAVRMHEGKKEVITLGRVTSIERDHKQLPQAPAGSPSVAIKIEAAGGNQVMYGRHLEESEILYSLISRRSIDTLKEFYRDEVKKDEWVLVKKLKGVFDIS